MRPSPRKLLYYIDGAECAPFTDWLKTLRDQKARTVIMKRLTRVELGNLGDCQSVGGGVYELRVDFGPGYRVYFGNDGDTIILLLCGGDKATQKTDIRRAQELWADYME